MLVIGAKQWGKTEHTSDAKTMSICTQTCRNVFIGDSKINYSEIIFH